MAKGDKKSKEMGRQRKGEFLKTPVFNLNN
jgi:hypothetical protein